MSCPTRTPAAAFPTSTPAVDAADVDVDVITRITPSPSPSITTTNEAATSTSLSSSSSIRVGRLVYEMWWHMLAHVMPTGIFVSSLSVSSSSSLPYFQPTLIQPILSICGNDHTGLVPLLFDMCLYHVQRHTHTNKSQQDVMTDDMSTAPPQHEKANVLWLGDKSGLEQHLVQLPIDGSTSEDRQLLDTIHVKYISSLEELNRYLAGFHLIEPRPTFLVIHHINRFLTATPNSPEYLSRLSITLALLHTALEYDTSHATRTLITPCRAVFTHDIMSTHETTRSMAIIARNAGMQINITASSSASTSTYDITFRGLSASCPALYAAPLTDTMTDTTPLFTTTTPTSTTIPRIIGASYMYQPTATSRTHVLSLCEIKKQPIIRTT